MATHRMRAPFEADAAHAEWQLTLPAGAPVRVLSDLGDGWSECEPPRWASSSCAPSAAMSRFRVPASRSSPHRLDRRLERREERRV